MYLVLMGMPGAGKGTQAALLEDHLQTVHITSGGLFRALKTQTTPLARKVQEIMASGALVPDDITIEIVRQRLQKADAREGFILDGFPRTLPQAECLDAVMAELDSRLTAVVFLKVSEAVVIDRIGGRRICTANEDHIFHVSCNPPQQEGICDICGAPLYTRADDQPEAIKKRLAQYCASTEPLLDYYESQGLLKTINAEQDIDAITADILDALNMAVPVEVE